MERKTVKERKMWTYKGTNIYPADRNSSGIRWTARDGSGIALRADSKAGMRELINHLLERDKFWGGRLHRSR